MTRADVIAAVLRRSVLERPLLGSELGERLVQGLGPRSTVVEWTATVPQLAEAVDRALVKADAAMPGSVAVGHALVVEYQGRDLVGTCQCGRRLGRIDARTRLDALTVPWIQHTTRDLAAAAAAHS
ncbi:hypothetical protein [Streptomyces sp. SID13726]|uniref:hypothetical protein n=1 Tax=Streptomyces sp. SID13726 TaxID=2706058 RepID=UPI0013B941FB|nr:hypothetical protein [Streptomyces sp. SID13726]NEB00596.1 hypothetical protein [Streptomyces sp. SID13726]